MSTLYHVFKRVVMNFKRWLKGYRIIRIIRNGIILYSAWYIFWKCYYKYYKYPPHICLGVPILGCIPFIAINQDKFALSLSNNGQYPITNVPLGPFQNAIFVNDINFAKRILKHKNIGPNRLEFNNIFHDPMDFAFISGNKWAKRRKPIANILNSVTNSSFIYNTIDGLFKKELYHKLDQGDPFYPSSYCNLIAFYTIFATIFGDNLPNFSSFYEQYMTLHLSTIQSILGYVGYSLVINIKIRESIFWKLFTAKSCMFEQEKFVKEYLINNNLLSALDRLNGTLSENIVDIMAVLIAGTETTALQMEFGLVMLCKFPSIQQKIYQQLMEINNGIYKPSLLNQLHFLRAFVYESLRVAIVSPNGLPHACLHENVEIDDYIIYKGNAVMINYLAINHENDDIFDISKWLDEDNKFNMKYGYNNFMIFGYSSRDCVGKNIALQQLYVVYSLLITKYVIYNNNLPTTINIVSDMFRKINPKIPIYFKSRN